ncbi:MAG: hypothetical protein RAP70_00645 [Candidatus Celaenobacter antarcticus]|nr:hypothetical protein [Candidatus Celaenobacter antarcticus]
MKKSMKDFLKEKQAKQNSKKSKSAQFSKKGSGKLTHFKKGHVKKG